MVQADAKQHGQACHEIDWQAAADPNDDSHNDVLVAFVNQ
ncbi:unnamed protein product, partial [marine sediment metagenome]